MVMSTLIFKYQLFIWPDQLLRGHFNLQITLSTELT